MRCASSSSGWAVIVLALAAACGAGAGGCSSSSAPGGSPGAPALDSGPAWAPDGPDTDTWASWGAAFFATYCVSCHSASDPKGLDFGVQSIVVANRDLIRCGVSVAQDPSWNCPADLPAKQFPISNSAGNNPKPTDADRDRVVDWIDAGCK